MLQTRCVHLTSNDTLKIPGANLNQIISILNTLSEQLEAWSDVFEHDVDYQFSTGFPWIKTPGKCTRFTTPVKQIRFWVKSPVDPKYNPVIGIELICHSGVRHSIMFNNLAFEEVKKRIKKLHDRFYGELLSDIARAHQEG